MAQPRICVLAVTSIVTVTVERSASGDDPEIHVHAGGQGLWVARMAASLGARVDVCGPFGGETGRLAAHLAQDEGFTVHATPRAGDNGAWVHDRRSGEREEVARMDPTPLGRHDLDDLFGTMLTRALDADVATLTGAEPADVVPADFFARLARDLRAAGRRVVADLSGEAAAAVVDERLDVLKISHEEMVEGGFAEGEGLEALLDGARGLLGRGAGAVVVSRAADPTLVVEPDAAHLVVAPPVSTVEHRGAGDSTTAGLSVGVARGLDLRDAVGLGAAAGALNVTRRGLGSGDRDQVERLAQEVRVRRVNRGPNTGHAVIHSGTVGATMSAMTHGIHGMAVSIAAADPRHWDTARLAAAHGLRFLTDRSAEDGVLNINVPDGPADQVRGVRRAPLARFGAVQARVDQLQAGGWQVTYSEIDPTADADSDAGLLAAGWVTMTLLQAPCYAPDADLPEADALLG